ncbi:MAG TPA: ABC transporter substrate-binding protein [Acidimicrobiales bacterium]|nr:ABC transporter substrate-binding protein [Acidimicrobiales bacterium]
MPDRIDRRSFLARGMLTASGVAVGGAGAGSLLAACSSGGSSGASGGSSGGGSNGISSATPKRGGQLIFGVEAEEQGFDPATGRFDETGVDYARTVFDPLTILAADGSVQPYLAQSVSPNGDYSQWTITTRPNVNFHDGSVCDAAAVAGSLEHFVKGLLGVTLRGIISNISAPTSNTVTVTLSQPWVAFPAYLAGGIGGQAGYIISPSMIANPNGSQNPVGTGPFKFQEWVPNDHFTAVRNQNYWRAGLPYLDSITYKPIVDSEQRANALLAGNIDIMHTDLPESILQFRANSSYGYIDDSQHVVGEPDMGFIMLNLTVDTFKDIRVRRAMAMAIDRQQYIRVIDKGVNPTEDQMFVRGTPYYTSDSGYPAYNPSQARSLVQQVARDTGKPVAFQLSSTTGASTVQAVQFLQNQLQAVGMQVQLNQIQQADLINDALGGAYEAVLWRQFAAVDPDLNYLFWSPTEIFGGLAVNFARNSDNQVETYLQTGRRSTDPATRATAYQNAAKQINQDLPYIWLDRAIWAIVANSKVQNFNNPTTPAGGKAYGMIVGTIWTPQIWLSS